MLCSMPYLNAPPHVQHASANGNDYGDMSCIMGLTAGLRCYNAPNSWAAGWASPIPGGDLVGTGTCLLSGWLARV